MASRLKVKPGRRANDGERQIARDWVELYRQAQQAPTSMLCLNPDDEPDIQTWIDASDPRPLLSLLENFAEHGTFEQVGKLFDSIRLLPLRHAYREGRRLGETHEVLVNKLADEYGLDPRTIERKLRTDKT